MHPASASVLEWYKALCNDRGHDSADSPVPAFAAAPALALLSLPDGFCALFGIGCVDCTAVGGFAAEEPSPGARAFDVDGEAPDDSFEAAGDDIEADGATPTSVESLADVVAFSISSRFDGIFALRAGAAVVGGGLT